MSSPVHDPAALRLERAGLWRRAAARWLDVMQHVELTDAQREWVCHRRRFCRLQLPCTEVPEPLDVVAINRAATAALKRMGPKPVW
ncbi:PerC family transcriptional regulator [Enterobacter cloacae]|nr:PerC family transcriptional regulator [Enterobacter cloacae]